MGRHVEVQRDTQLGCMTGGSLPTGRKQSLKPQCDLHRYLRFLIALRGFGTDYARDSRCGYGCFLIAL